VRGVKSLKKRSLFSIVLVLPLVFTYHSNAFASKLNDLQNQKKQVEEKSSSVNSSIDKKDAQISDISGKQVDLATQMRQIESQIASTDKKIGEKQTQINDTQKQITTLQNSIAELTKRIQERDQLLKQRARAMQTNGGSVNYLDVILDAESISDLIDRLSAVTTLVSADKEIMDQQKKDQDVLVQQKAEVEKKLKDLRGMVNELQSLKSNLNQQQAKKAEILKQLGEKKTQLESQKMSLQEEKENLAAQKSAIAKAIKLEKDRIAREAAEKAAAERAAKQRSQSSGSSSNSSSSGNTSSGGSSTSSGGGGSASGSASTPSVTSGTFMRPAVGRVTSEFGNRSFDADGFHSGIDIAQGGLVPIVAAGDGVVFRSYLSDSYGNCVMITHVVNGNVYTTVYAHMRNRLVSNGQSVHKGQVIGYMGETGEAYGQHLHFEFYVGEWTASHSNAVNPRNYINF